MTNDTATEMPGSRATFAAGCFWGVEETFLRQPGVLATRVGYTGGHAPQPTYHEVCQDTTGHAEAVEVVFDPAQVSYEDLLAVFWACHDPTQVNRQGPDIGSQYRSAVFVHDAEQEALARASLAREVPRHRRPIATQIVRVGPFWMAEAYHQQYLRRYRPGAAACGVCG
ncbi:peptide-methionine (S)-S-oxide reductase MsrA [Pararhodospirillum photometricum]|uniref:Peptide methionine sulfoxide reductase MsrA n=1 Tax=Pararhodospirillum photometricum DSM 122 TaxID=1150469 RepID=H6SRG9_PARPM|nr:peptide-methionine (S)-S-oxide reductase MsrA [Pararhodospirillum photometricum]CCG07498.1 Peptide methionine sulfoxide reductase msrA [Pararhodospirillum photometricum DSM 122]